MKTLHQYHSTSAIQSGRWDLSAGNYPPGLRVPVFAFKLNSFQVWEDVFLYVTIGRIICRLRSSLDVMYLAIPYIEFLF